MSIYNVILYAYQSEYQPCLYVSHISKYQPSHQPIQTNIRNKYIYIYIYVMYCSSLNHSVNDVSLNQNSQLHQSLDG